MRCSLLLDSLETVWVSIRLNMKRVYRGWVYQTLLPIHVASQIIYWSHKKCGTVRV